MQLSYFIQLRASWLLQVYAYINNQTVSKNISFKSNTLLFHTSNTKSNNLVLLELSTQNYGQGQWP